MVPPCKNANARKKVVCVKGDRRSKPLSDLSSKSFVSISTTFQDLDSLNLVLEATNPAPGSVSIVYQCHSK